MALAERLATTPDAQVGGRCTVCDLTAALSPDDAETLTGWLKSNIRYTTITDALKAEGHDIGPSSLSRHSRGQCKAGVRLR